MMRAQQIRGGKPKGLSLEGHSSWFGEARCPCRTRFPKRRSVSGGPVGQDAGDALTRRPGLFLAVFPHPCSGSSAQPCSPGFFIAVALEE
jgi:hypothetical protein